MPAQIRSHAKRTLAPGSMQGHEIFHITPIVEQFLGAQTIEQRRNDRCIVALLDQFEPQVLGCIIAPRQRVERENPRRAGVQGQEWPSNQGVTPL